MNHNFDLYLIIVKSKMDESNPDFKWSIIMFPSEYLDSVIIAF